MTALFGEDPRSSWRRFVAGLVIFIPGAGLILFGMQAPHWLQIPGMLLCAIGFVTAMWGYAGLLWHRLRSAVRQPNVYPHNDKNAP